MYLTSYKRVREQWVLDVATSPKTWDGLSVGDVLYYPDGREGIISAKMDTPSSPVPVSGGEYLSKGIRVAFPSYPKDRILTPWKEGYISLDSVKPASVSDVVSEIPDRVAKLPDTISMGVISLWDAIPGWVKWGGAGAVVVYLAGPYLLSRELRQ